MYEIIGQARTDMLACMGIVLLIGIALLALVSIYYAITDRLQKMKEKRLNAEFPRIICYCKDCDNYNGERCSIFGHGWLNHDYCSYANPQNSTPGGKS